MYTMLRSSHITRHFSSSSLLPPLKVAICGAGTVGGGVIEILSKRQDEVKGLRRTFSIDLSLIFYFYPLHKVKKLNLMMFHTQLLCVVFFTILHRKIRYDDSFSTKRTS